MKLKKETVIWASIALVLFGYIPLAILVWIVYFALRTDLE